ncbi:MAG: recombinase family protein [Oscillospiraceae bacterium]|jgi:hypothetical protein|nr:recombinase family protein [Oscillospiraceae bacterium]
MPYSVFLGYEKGEDGAPQIVPEQAEVVRLIYKLYMEGKTAYAIANILTGMGISTPAGKVKWHQNVIYPCQRALQRRCQTSKTARS